MKYIMHKSDVLQNKLFGNTFKSFSEQINTQGDPFYDKSLIHDNIYHTAMFDISRYITNTSAKPHIEIFRKLYIDIIKEKDPLFAIEYDILYTRSTGVDDYFKISSEKSHIFKTSRNFFPYWNDPFSRVYRIFTLHKTDIRSRLSGVFLF